MNGVKAIAGFSVLMAILLLTTPISSGWESGQTWGYKWEADWKDTLNNSDSNTTFQGSIEGKTVHMFFVKYMGKENGEYKFHYEGSYYSYGYIKGSVNQHSSFGYLNGTVDIKQKSFWVNYQGDFHLVKAVDHEGLKEVTYYGMKDISIHVYTKEPINIHIAGKYIGESMSSKNTINIKIELKGIIDINTLINFEKPIPYLPDNSTPDFVGTQTSANYSGHWKVHTEGYSYQNDSSQGIGANRSLEMNVSLNKNIDTSFSGTLDDVFVMMSKHGNSVSRCGILENIPFAITEIYSSQVTHNSNKTDVSGFINNALILNHNAKYHGDFYSSVNEEENSGSLIVSVHGEGYSEPATENEVKSVENNAPAEYGSYQEEGFFIPILYLIIIAVVAAIIVVAIVVIVKKKH